MSQDRVREELPGQGNLLQSGRVLDGRYEITEFLGAGAFAAVYSARQLKINRAVAIKILNIVNAWQDPTTRKAFGDRFLREAQTAAQIKHPGVVDIYDYGIIDELGQPYIVMELLQGHDLEHELRQIGPIAPERAWRLMIGCLEALAEAHDQGIIHKDLKPSNLFLVEPGTRKERLKIVDFGIARIQEREGQKLTGTGQLFGTPQYLAPEYIERQIATPALDVYQMGLILVEMLTGRTVVDIDNPYKCLMIHVNGELALPPALMSGPAGPTLRHALHADHEKRLPHAAAFVEALRRIDPTKVSIGAPVSPERTLLGTASTDVLTQPPMTPTPIAPLQQPGPSTQPPAAFDEPPPRRSMLPLALGALGLVLLLGLGVAAAVAFSGGDDAAPDPLTQRTDGAHNALGAEEADRAEPAPKPEEEEEGVQSPTSAPLAQPPTSAPAEEKPPAPTPRTVEVRAMPLSAHAFIGDRDLGVVPVRIDFKGEADAPVQVRIERKGYAPTTITVKPTDGPTVEVALQPQSAADATRPPRGGERPRGGEAGGKGGGGDNKGTTAAANPTPPTSTQPPKGEGKGKTGMGFVDENKGKGNTGQKTGIGFVE